MRILNTKTLHLLKRIRQDFVQPETYFSCNFVCLRSLVIMSRLERRCMHDELQIHG